MNPKRTTPLNWMLAILLTLGGLAFLPAASGQAALTKDPPGPDRVSTITVKYTAYTWWMATWNKNQIVCTIVVDHDGQPTLGEVYTNCDPTVYYTWKKQPPCVGTSHSDCPGYYLYLVRTEQTQKQVAVTLPPPSVWVSLEGCESVSGSGTSICETIPRLILKGEEPLPNEHILRVEGTMDGQPFTCNAICKLQLAPTENQGVDLQFWAWSSYGDSSEAFTAQVRVATADAGNPDKKSWYVDVLSSQWLGVHPATCADTWKSFPPVGGPPEWLSMPSDPADLSSDIPYNYLSANLILQGVVDASKCPDGGWSSDGNVNQCGPRSGAALGRSLAKPVQLVDPQHFTRDRRTRSIAQEFFRARKPVLAGRFQSQPRCGSGTVDRKRRGHGPDLESVVLQSILPAGAFIENMQSRVRSP